MGVKAGAWSGVAPAGKYRPARVYTGMAVCYDASFRLVGGG